MKATVTWQKDLTFLAESDNGMSQLLAGDGSHLSPMQAVLQAVGGCSSIDVVMILQKARQQVTGCVCEIEAERATTDPKVFTKIHCHYKVTGTDLNEKHVQRACDLSMEKYCSVSLMLKGKVIIEHSWEVIEA